MAAHVSAVKSNLEEFAQALRERLGDGASAASALEAFADTDAQGAHAVFCKLILSPTVRARVATASEEVDVEVNLEEEAELEAAPPRTTARARR